MKLIFQDNHCLYGYRRIGLELQNRGMKVNSKKIRRLMNKYELYCLVRKKRKYSSYQGTIGKVADNLIQRQFYASKPNQKWFSDVTEFRFGDKKLYLSPILDAHGGYVVSYNISQTPNLKQTQAMFDEAFKIHPNVNGLIFHTDQGWQYQHYSTQQVLKDHGILQSMSRKGNSLDNGMMESFFGTLKSEMFYNRIKSYRTIVELEAAIHDYIKYYNSRRIKTKLKGLTPEQFRYQSLNLKL